MEKEKFIKIISGIKDICSLILCVYSSPLHTLVLNYFGGVICIFAIVIIILYVLIKHTNLLLIDLEEE